MKLLFFDLETTGVNPGKNGIHQISGMIEIDGVEQALAVAGVTREQVMAYPSMHEVYNQKVRREES